MENRKILPLIFLIILYLVFAIYTSLSNQNYNTKLISEFENELEDMKEEYMILEKERDTLKKELKSTTDELNRVKQEVNKTSNRKGSQTLNKEKLGEFEATAYTTPRDGRGGWTGKTATGTTPKIGVVAVDPNVIPLGTKLYVDGYGECVAEDTGGVIKGKKIDLFMQDRGTCLDFGRRKVIVHKIKK